MQTDIGNVMIHPTGTNPYDRDVGNPYRFGQDRVQALKNFRDTGTLPEGYSLWSNRHKVRIASPNEVDWSGLSE